MSNAGPLAAFLPFQQSPVYAAAVAACGARVRWLDLGCGRALALERGRLRTVLRGPIWEAGRHGAERLQAMRRLARWPGITVVTPEEEIAGLGLIPLVTPMHLAVWSLAGDLRTRMAGKWRNRLVAAEAAGVWVQRGDQNTLDGLIQAESAQRATRRYRALPEGFTRSLPDTALRLWEWRHGGRTAAAMAFVVHGSTATYHLAWGSEPARAARVHGLMLTRAAEALQDEGVTWLDLGSLDTEAAPGLARFKLGTGAAIKRLGATALVLP